MTLSTDTIDQIVANVLSQLSSPGKTVSDVSSPPQSVEKHSRHRLAGSVVTADQLENLETGRVVLVGEKAIITPAAGDVVRERKLVIERTSGSSGLPKTVDTNPRRVYSKLSVAIVRHTDNAQQAIEELGELNRELVSCPDDAAKFAISELCRGGAETVLIFAEQTHRAACLANRNSKAKAVVVKDSGDVKTVRKQLRANVWCIDPADRSYFELKNLLKVIRS